MKRRRFLALPLARRRRAARAEVRLSRASCRGRAASFRAITARIRSFAPSGGTSRAGSPMRAGSEYGVQVTFFRNRPRRRRGESERVRAAAARVRARGARRSAPRTAAATTSAPRARASVSPAPTRRSTRVWIDDWSLARVDGALCREDRRARVRARSAHSRRRSRCFCKATADCRARVRDAAQASYYYSEPQLAVSGHDRRRRRGASPSPAPRGSITSGRATVMAPEAAGWDWTGINLADGGALMAFRMRDKAGGTLWAGGALRERRWPRAHVRARRGPLRAVYGRGARRAPASTYPVAMRVERRRHRARRWSR